MYRISNAVKILVTGIFLCGIFLIGGKASAEAIDAEAMQIFRDTVAQTAGRDTSPFHQDIFFVMPQITSSLTFLASTARDTLKLEGDFELWTIGEDGKYIELDVPFYLDQTDKNMILYFQTDKKWKKITTPISAANLVDMVATPNSQERSQMVDCVKNVTVLKDNDAQRILLVQLDGAKIYQSLKAEMKNDPEIQAQQNTEIAKALDSYIENGFANADIWYTWTVDKATWQTTTMSFNLSGLLQSIARTALSDTESEIMSLEPVRQMLEAVAFYSECKAYTNYLNPNTARVEIPKNVISKAKEVESLTDDGKSKK